MLKMRSTWLAWAGVLGVCLAVPAIQATRSEALVRPAAGQLAPRQGAVTRMRMPERDAGLPAPAHAHATSPYEVEMAVQKARARGEGENEVYRLRAAAMSTQMIAALTERERAEKQWQRRVDAWRAERATLNQADAAGLQALRGRLFSADEQRLLDAAEPAATAQLTQREFAQ